MAKFLDIAVETDIDTLRQNVYEVLQEHFPEWEPLDGNLETWMIEAFTRAVADLRELAADVPVAIFKQYGETIIGIPAHSAVAATAKTSWTVADTAGYKIPAGTELGLRVNGELKGFKTVEELVIPGGEDSATEVLVEATEAGADQNGLTGEMIVISSVLGEPQVTLEEATSEGVDEETEIAYLERLVSELQILSPTPIKPNDFVVIAQRRPEVGRAVALNLYNPEDETWENERYVTTAVTDTEGGKLSEKVKEELEAEYEELREVNFVAPVVDANYNKVDVKVKVVAYDLFDTTALKEQIEQQLASFFDPSRWGVPLFGQADEWVYTNKVHLSKVEVAVGLVRGVDYIEELKIAKHGGVLAAADLELEGAAPLTEIGTVTVEVVAP